MMSYRRSLNFVAALALCSSVLPAQMPAGWGLAGSKPGDYSCSLDSSVTYQGQPAVYLKAKPDSELSGFGTMSQYFSAAQFAGKRVRFSANIKSQGIDPRARGESWAGLWLRIDGDPSGGNGGPKPLIMDNMHQTGTDRAIKGTRDWQNYSVVLDVAPNATGVGLGVLLSGAGELWISGMKFEVVGLNVPVTVEKTVAHGMADGPVNLSFEN
jgi:hypothetical protein